MQSLVELEWCALTRPRFCYPWSMFDWIGSLRIREHSGSRVVLGLSVTTRIAGGVMAFVGAAAVLRLWNVSGLAALFPAALALFGVVLLTLEREIVVDRSAGTLVLKQRVFGVGTENVVPLFHLRAVVVMAKQGLGAGSRSRFVAYLDRRVGDSIFLDEARRCAGLLQIAEAIAEIAELRLEYDAGAASSAS